MFLPGHAMTDLDGRFLSVDDRFCESIRRERAEVIGRSILEITVDTDRAANALKLSALCERNEAFTIRKHYVSGDRTHIKVENHVAMMADGRGGQRLIATVVPLLTPKPDVIFGNMLKAARRLADERKLRTRAFGEILSSDPRWDLMLAAYILEAEGRSTFSFEVCEAAGVEEQAGILSLWQLIASDHLVPEGRALVLRDVGIALSTKGMTLLTEHLRRLRGFVAFP